MKNINDVIRDLPDDRRRAINLRVGELSAVHVEMLKRSKMDAKHNHLNKLLKPEA